MDQVLEEGPSQEDLDAIRAAVQELCNKKRAAGFKVSDLKLLYENRYHDLDCLEIATRDGLKDSGIKPGLIDAILEGQKERRKEKAEKPAAGQEEWRGAREVATGAGQQRGAEGAPAQVFLGYLNELGIRPRDSVLAYITTMCYPQLAAVMNAEGAQMLYNHAARLPHTATRVMLSETCHVTFDGPFAAPSGGRSTFVYASRNGVPYLAKIPYDARCARQEVDAWTLAHKHDECGCLAGPLEHLSFPASSALELRGGSLEARAAILMPIYCMTMQQFLKLDEDLALQHARRLRNALSAMHNAEKIHCDVKAANIFIDSLGSSFLGDYGSVVARKSRVLETTRELLPKDHDEQLPERLLEFAEPQLDFMMLAATLLLGLGLLPHTPGHWGMASPRDFTLKDMQTGIKSVKSVELRDLLESFVVPPLPV